MLWADTTTTTASCCRIETYYDGLNNNSNTITFVVPKRFDTKFWGAGLINLNSRKQYASCLQLGEELGSYAR